MKSLVLNIVILTALYLFPSSCQQSRGDLPCIDVSKNHPEKEILLTDIADITYLLLSSDNDEYLYRGGIRAITENVVVIVDHKDGTVLFFDRNGQPKSRFNHRGNGPKEYRNIHRLLYDEDTDEVFVTSYYSPIILVYNSFGEYKREFESPTGTRIGNEVVSFDDTSIFFYDVSIEGKRFDMDFKNLPKSDLVSSFYRISKSDGAVLDCVELMMNPIFLGISNDGNIVSGNVKRMVQSSEGVYLCNPENDTVFLYNKSQFITPVLHKTPLVSATTPMTYLNNCVDVGNYQFMQIFSVKREEGAFPFPAKYYMLDKSTGKVVKPILHLTDFVGNEFVIDVYKMLFTGKETLIYFELDNIELKQAYAEKKLNGKLKELVATLKEDDNNIYVMAQFK
ncbi:MAG: 6-bladed beta-propeller [Prevotellaceae bacterium]|jgi:hypothetical protein|nr:6-bladed beta-propeller [Prevotellaceae bacterium]